MSSASSRTRRCFEIAGSEMLKGLASSVTEDSAFDNLARIARRVGLERAEKVKSRFLESCDPLFLFRRVSGRGLPLRPADDGQPNRWGSAWEPSEECPNEGRRADVFMIARWESYSMIFIHSVNHCIVASVANRMHARVILRGSAAQSYFTDCLSGSWV